MTRVSNRRQEEITRAVRSVRGRVRYPLRDVNEAVRQLGGDSAEVEYAGKRRKIKDLKKCFTEEDFPIESEEEAIGKIAQVEVRKSDDDEEEEED